MAVYETIDRISGEQLRAARVKADVSVRQIARSMGVARQRVQSLEGQASVSLPAARRYIDALGDALTAALAEADA